jgi:hypothetical protein
MSAMTFLLRTSVCCLALANVVGCGEDDDKPAVDADDNEGGAASIHIPAPALGKDDCAVTTSKLELSQPEGADVWGGLVVVEFEVEGAKTRSFDIQIFDPTLDAWVNSYVEVGSSGQREDGSYFLAVRPTYNDANKNEELKLRVRPTQEGCPNAEWTESEGFTARDPVAGTSWSAELPSEFLTGSIIVQRTALPDMPLPPVELALGDATLAVEFGTKGELTQHVTIPLDAEKGEPYAGCTLSLTFSGTYDLVLRSWGGLTLVTSEQALTSTEGTTCELPSLDEMALSADAFDLPLSGTTVSVNIDYQPTLLVTPGAPVWRDGFGQVFQVIPQYLGYETSEEIGNASGFLQPQELTLVRD